MLRLSAFGVVLFLLTAGSCPAAEGARYLVISADEFAPVVQPLAEWHNAAGLKSRVVKLSETGSDSAGIRAYILNACENWPIQPEYILLVGGQDYLPSCRYQSGSYVYYSDNYYADIEGDFRAELSLGRLPARSTRQCSVMVAKTLGYLRSPNQADTAWTRRLTTVVREDGDDDDTVYWNDARMVAGLAAANGSIGCDSLSRLRGDSAIDVYSSLAGGTGLVLYRGSAVGNWYSPFQMNPDLCTNGDRLPVIVSATCQTLTLAPRESMVGEAWVKAGTVASPKGAVAFFGNTVSSSNVARVRSALTRGFATGLFVEGLYRLGDAARRGREQLYQEFPGYVSNYQGFNVLGDPALAIWTGRPRELAAAHPAELDIGPQEVAVTVTHGGAPVESALVCCSMDTSVHVWGYTDANGSVTLQVAPRDTGRLRLVASGRNCLPYDTLLPVVRMHNLACSWIGAPAGAVDSGAAVVPACSVYNFGARVEDYTVRMRCGDSSGLLATVTGHQPGTGRLVEFPEPWIPAARGWQPVTCSTELALDSDPTNDRQEEWVFVQVRDVAPVALLEPGPAESLGTVITPAAVWRNLGNVSVARLKLFMFLHNPGGTRVYADSASVLSLGPDAEIREEFRSLTLAAAGRWQVKCSTALSSDMVGANDMLVAGSEVSGSVQAGWTEVAQVPTSPSGKLPYEGAWMVETRNLLYIAKGAKTGDFFSYDPVANVWATLPLRPIAADGKGPSKGSAACADGELIYTTTGNNTLGFWCYNIETGTWTQLADVPPGASGKKVRGGADMVFLKAGTGQTTGYVYLLKGGGTEFMRFNTDTQVWEVLPDAPAGTRAKWDKGSWLAVQKQVGQDVYNIWAHKARYHEMYVFDAVTQTWGPQLSGMPFLSATGKSKRSKAGGSAAFDDGALWALKGGNTCEFWHYDVETATWTELTPMPEIGSTGKKKRVKAGGDIVSYGDGVFFALKGGKTAELWQYCATSAVARQPGPVRSGVMAEPTVKGFGFTLAPNPAKAGQATLSYSLPNAGAAKVTVFDMAGRAVTTLGLAGRTGTAALDLGNPGAGVYLVKLEASGYSTTTKLVVQ